MKINIQLFGGRGVSSGMYSFYLPKNPKKSNRFIDVTDPRKRKNTDSLNFKDRESGLEIEFHAGRQGQKGWRGKDHYHIKNPDSTNDNNYYLDKNGNPCPKGSKDSHLVPGEYKNLLRRIKDDK